MSVVSTVIITTWLGEADSYKLPKAIKFLNKRTDFGSGSFVPVHDYTTGKHPECYIFLAAYNYLRWEEFVEAVKNAPWKFPDRVQILWRDDKEYLFKSFVLKDFQKDGK